MAYVDYPYESSNETWATHYILPHLMQMMSKAEGPILDLGCGNGAIASKLLDQGWDVFGIDASESGIEVANSKSPGRFFRMDLDTQDIPPNLKNIRFQTVISTEVIEHLYNPRSLIRIAKKLLGDQGNLILSTPYHGYIKNLALAASGKMDQHFTALWDCGHIKFFSRRTLESLLREEGFEAMEFRGAGRVPYLWKSMIIKAKCRS